MEKKCEIKMQRCIRESGIQDVVKSILHPITDVIDEHVLSKGIPCSHESFQEQVV